MEIFPWKTSATLRRREGLPRCRGPPKHGHARLNGGELSGPPR